MLDKSNYLGDQFITTYLHPLFGAENDSKMFSQMVWISFFYTLSVAVSMAIFPAPYGKRYLCLSILNIIKVTQLSLKDDTAAQSMDSSFLQRWLGLLKNPPLL